MPVVTDEDGRDDNEGPHCRNCHIGANNCDVCHADASTNFSAAYTSVVTTQTAGKTNYSPQSYLKQSAVANLNGKCIDGGFSFPHRTLGANMLKDELYGVDFDGTPVAFGGSRTTNGGAAPSVTATFSIDSVPSGTDFVMWTGEKQNATSIVPAIRTDVIALQGTAVENLDSVCIDCHGDGTYWNGDNTSFLKTEGASALPLGTYGSGQFGGWDMLLKGLP